MPLPARYWPKEAVTFAPEPYDDVAALRFAAAAEMRWGLRMGEARILFALCCGYTDCKALGQTLFQEVKTTKGYRSIVYDKLGVPDAPAAVTRAWRLYRAARKERA